MILIKKCQVVMQNVFCMDDRLKVENLISSDESVDESG